MRSMFDAAVPQPLSEIQGFDVAAGYLGYPGATPHTWSVADWNSQSNRWRFPIMVPSWWAGQGWDAIADAAYALSKLREIDAPTGILTGLDMETQIQPGYVSTYVARMNSFGYSVAVYGSTSTVFQNHADTVGGFYWPADPDRHQAAMMDANRLQALGLSVSAAPYIVATQYGQKTGSGVDYDLNVILDIVPLWDTQKGNPVGLTIPPSIAQHWPDQAGNFPPGAPYTDDNAIIWSDAGAREAADKSNAALAAVNALAAQVSAGVTVKTGPASLAISDTDVQRIASAVVQLLGRDISNG